MHAKRARWPRWGKFMSGAQELDLKGAVPGALHAPGRRGPERGRACLGWRDARKGDCRDLGRELPHLMAVLPYLMSVGQGAPRRGCKECD